MRLVGDKMSSMLSLLSVVKVVDEEAVKKIMLSLEKCKMAVCDSGQL